MTPDLRFGVVVGMALCFAAWAAYLLFRIVCLKGEVEGAEERVSELEAKNAGLDARMRAASETIEAQRARIDNLLAAVGGTGAISAVGKPHP